MVISSKERRWQQKVRGLTPRRKEGWLPQENASLFQALRNQVSPREQSWGCWSNRRPLHTAGPARHRPVKHWWEKKGRRIGETGPGPCRVHSRLTLWERRPVREQSCGGTRKKSPICRQDLEGLQEGKLEPDSEKQVDFCSWFSFVFIFYHVPKRIWSNFELECPQLRSGLRADKTTGSKAQNNDKWTQPRQGGERSTVGWWDRGNGAVGGASLAQVRGDEGSDQGRISGPGTEVPAWRHLIKQHLQGWPQMKCGGLKETEELKNMLKFLILVQTRWKHNQPRRKIWDKCQAEQYLGGNEAVSVEPVCLEF